MHCGYSYENWQHEMAADPYPHLSNKNIELECATHSKSAAYSLLAQLNYSACLWKNRGGQEEKKKAVVAYLYFSLSLSLSLPLSLPPVEEAGFAS